MMDKGKYDEKMASLLDDQKTYEKLDKDPTPTLERKMNAMLLRMKKAGSISDRLYDRLRCSAGRLPLLYGLPKVHKPEVPLRPIVSFVHSPTYQLSKHLAKLLSPLVGNSPSHVRNSHSFCQFIQPQVLREGEVLIPGSILKQRSIFQEKWSTQNIFSDNIGPSWKILVHLDVSVQQSCLYSAVVVSVKCFNI